MKKNIWRNLCAFLICGFTFGCSFGQRNVVKEVSPVEQLKWVEFANFDLDLRAALKQKDYRYWGVTMFSDYAPGVKSECYRLSNARFIRGTSDSIMGDEHNRLISMGHVYAIKYNQRLLKIRNPSRNEDCATSKP